MENMDDFHCAKKAITCNHQINIFAIKMNVTHWLVHKECIVPTVVCQKAHLRLKRRRKNQAHSVNCYRVTLV